MPSWNNHLGTFLVEISHISKGADGSNAYHIGLTNQKAEVKVEIVRSSAEMKAFHETLLETTKHMDVDSKPTLPDLTGEEDVEQMLHYWHCVFSFISTEGADNAAEATLIFTDDDIKDKHSFYFVTKCSAMNELLRHSSLQLTSLHRGQAEDHQTLKSILTAVEDMHMRLGLLEDTSTVAPIRRESKQLDIAAFATDSILKVSLNDSRRNSYRSDGSHTDTETKNSDSLADDGSERISPSGASKRKSLNSASGDSDSGIPSVIFEEGASDTSSHNPTALKSGTSAPDMSFDSWVDKKKEKLRTDVGLYGPECLVAPEMRPFERSEHLPPSIMPRNVEKGIQDEVLDQILMLVTPQKCQTLYRNFVAKFFCHRIRKTLGIRADTADLSQVKCNLPDDPISISICVKNEIANKWHTIMLPIFRKLIGTNSLSHSRGDVSALGSLQPGAGISGPGAGPGAVYPSLSTRMQGYYASQGGASSSMSSSPEMYPNHLRPSGMSSGDSGPETDSDAPAEWQHAEFSITYATAQIIGIVEGCTFPDEDRGVVSVGAQGVGGVDLSGPPDRAYFSKAVGSAPGPAVGVPEEDAPLKEEAYIECGVDNLAIMVSANKNASMAMVALVEQTSALVGKDNLFKNSLVLIRAWWAYETTTYVGSNIRHYLSDDAICVMVISIFNRYHSTLHQPLQALVMFLAEYSEMDWTNQAITVQGIVPFRNKSSPTLCPSAPLNSADADWQPSYPWLMNPTKGQLLTPHWIKVFWGLVNVRDISTAEPVVFPTAVEAAAATVVGASGPDQGDAGAGVTPGAGSVDAKGSSAPTATVSSSGASNHDVEEEGERAYLSVPLVDMPEERIKRFTRSHVNIVSPLSHSNLFLSKGGGGRSPLMRSQREVDRKRAYRRRHFLEKVFITGARKLAMALRVHDTRANGSHSISANLTLLSHFFNGTSVRYSFGTRPDVFPGVHLDDDDDLDEASFDLSGLGDDYNRQRTTSMQSDPPSIADSELSVSGYNSAPSSPRASFISQGGAGGASVAGQSSVVGAIWSRLQYHNLIIRKYLSGTALVMVVDEILESRGALPVGEIGKMLQELKIPSLSTKLKEVFGGLKKFLETSSHRYFLGDDHQFNPHVMLLRDIVAAGELENAKQGINADFVSRFKKMRPKRRPSNSAAHHTEMGTPSAGRLAVANIAMDNYVASRAMPVPPAVSAPGAGRARMRDMPAPQGHYVGTQEQYLDQTGYPGNNLSSEYSKQYWRQHAAGQASRGGPTGGQPQSGQGQGGAGGLRGQHSGFYGEVGLSNNEEALSGLSITSPSISGVVGGVRSSTHYHHLLQQQQQQQRQHQQQHQHQHQPQQHQSQFQSQIQQQQQYEGMAQQLDAPYHHQYSNSGDLSANNAPQDSHFGSRGLYGGQAEQMNQLGVGWADSISNHSSNDNSRNNSRKGEHFDEFYWQDP